MGIMVLISQGFLNRMKQQTKKALRLALGLLLCFLFLIVIPVESKAQINCGDTISQDIVLTEDLACPEGSGPAIVIDASNITLDLGGHTISGHTPGVGIFVFQQEGIIIKNGVVDGFSDGIFILQTNHVILEDLLISNLTSDDPAQPVFGIHIDGCQDVVVRRIIFEFLTVAHKEGVEIFDSYVDISDIELRSGGAGVSFSYAGEACDPVNHPSNGVVRDSKFSNAYGAGIWVACTSSALIESNDISTPPGVGVGIQAEGQFPGAVAGLSITNNIIHDAMIGVELRGVVQASVIDNYIFDHPYWGIAIRQSLGCLVPQPGWECFNSTENVVSNNETWGSGTDLYHCDNCTGNTWTGNTCETTLGSEIPACMQPNVALTVNYFTGKSGSFFTFEGANFPANSVTTISVNGNSLGAITTDPSGDLLFLLNTEQADIGDYVVIASANSSATARFSLKNSAPLRPQEGMGTVFKVPSGLIPHFIFLPLLMK